MEIINQIGSLLVASGAVGTLLFYRSKRRKESAGAYKLELDALKEEIVFLTDRLDKIREETKKLRDDFVSLKEYSMNLEIELIAEKHAKELAQSMICTSVGCKNRLKQKVN